MMETIMGFFENLKDQEWLREHGGMYVVMFIVFAETGLFIGFFLPGDYLLFLAGVLLNGWGGPTGNSFTDYLIWSTAITACAIVGNYVGYYFGYKSGDYLFKKEDTWYLKKKHLIQARDFYEKKGGVAIIIARFLPIIRTFAPIIAGIVKMNFRTFTIYNIIGGAIWVYGLTIAGYFLAKVDWVRENLDYIVYVLILITTVPVMYKMIFSKNKVENKPAEHN